MAWATTYYVRPADDGNGNALTYGTGTGLSSANAWAGFSAITGLAAGDTVCLPGGNEIFYDRLVTGTNGTLALPVTYKGCGATQAVIWHATELTGNRSFDSARAAVSSATYAWSTVSTDLYKKRIDVRPLMLWENTTWLQPVNIDAASEATIIATLTAGQWGVRDTGGSTYAIYYKATSSSKSPTTATIRCDNIPLGNGTTYPGLINNTTKHYQIIQNIELRGYSASANSFAVIVEDSHDVTLDNVLVYRGSLGPALTCPSSTCYNLILRDVSVLYNSWSGLYISPDNGMSHVLVSGGSYNYAAGTRYNGTSFTSGDGDGIGIGQDGGTGSDFVIENVETNGNQNGITIATVNPMTVTNVLFRGIRMDGNTSYCFSATDQVEGYLTLTGFTCANTVSSSGAAVVTDGSTTNPVTITISNGTFSNNINVADLFFRANANALHRFINLVFTNNSSTTGPGGWCCNIKGDAADLIGTEIFKGLWFYGYPNQNQSFARMNLAQTRYKYNSGTDLASFNTLTGGSNNTLNTDPQLISTTDLRTIGASPLRRTGTTGYACRDARNRPCWSPPDIGAYQATSGDPASTRSAATTRSPATPRSLSITRSNR